MRIKVNMELCSGHARCAAVAPEVYRLDSDGYCGSDGQEVAAALIDQARRGARACPESAITFDE